MKSRPDERNKNVEVVVEYIYIVFAYVNTTHIPAPDDEAQKGNCRNEEADREAEIIKEPKEASVCRRRMRIMDWEMAKRMTKLEEEP